MAELMVYKLYSATAGDAAASLDILFNGAIQGMLFDLTVTGADALNDGMSLEVSFASVSGMVANDTRASIGGIKSNQGFLTSGGGQTGKAVAVTFGMDGIPVAAGERIYLHTASTGTVTFAASVWLYVRVTDSRQIMRRRL